MSDDNDLVVHPDPDRWRSMLPGERERWLMNVHKARTRNPSIVVGLKAYAVLWWDARGRAHRREFAKRADAERFIATSSEAATA